MEGYLIRLTVHGTGGSYQVQIYRGEDVRYIAWFSNEPMAKIILADKSHLYVTVPNARRIAEWIANAGRNEVLELEEGGNK